MSVAEEGVFEPRKEAEPTDGAAEKDVVVIGVDGSDQAEQAFQWYLDNLHKKGNEVILVHAVEIPSTTTKESWEKQVEAGKAKHQKLEDKFTKKFTDKGIAGRFVTGQEKPGVLVCEVAKNENATYVVTGTRGLGKMRRTILGSVSDYCVHHATCPVVVARMK